MLNKVKFTLLKGKDGFENEGYRVVHSSDKLNLQHWYHLKQPKKQSTGDSDYTMGYMIFNSLEDARKFSFKNNKNVYKVRYRKVLSIGTVDIDGEEVECLTTRQVCYEQLIESHIDGKVYNVPSDSNSSINTDN